MKFKGVGVKFLKTIFYTAMLLMLFTQISCGVSKIFSEEPPELRLSNEEKTAMIGDKRKQPIFIGKPVPDNVMYAGFTNEIKVYMEGGSTDHLHVYSASGPLKEVDKNKGIYSFYERTPGFLTEIIAEDTILGTLVSAQFKVIDIPIPTAYVWKYRTPLNLEKAADFTAKDFMEQNGITLYHNSYWNVPSRCEPTSYTILRISKKGERTTYDNKDKRGLFDEAAIKIINQAEAGDVYIFKDIQTNCTKLPANDIVYLMK